MKTIFLTIIITASVVIGYAQDTSNKSDYEYFIVLYTLGENWDTTKQAHEQLYFSDHSSHLSGLRKTKQIDIGGRYGDTGMILLKAKDEAEAQNLVKKDIAIQNKIFTAKIFSFNPFYTGCIE